MAHSWDPTTYLAFGDERARPFFDLVARIGAEAPERVVDLGCGPGTLTATLRERWPSSEVRGVDASAEMVAAAERLADERLSFEVADLCEFRPRVPVDVLVSNATLHWVPHQGAALEPFLASLLRSLAPGGWLAFQVPGNFGAPVHTLLRALASDPRFADHTTGLTWPGSAEPDEYLAALLGLGCRVQVWETTYLHVLGGPDPVLRWISGAGARPVLQALPDLPRAEFEAEYAEALREAYPARPFGTVLPFRRIFAVAQTPR
ncbi:MAG: methyltransferase domain-containing protein [Nocardioidaceae bacterium]